MTENEIKAIKWIRNVRDDAVITLDHIQKNEPNVSPMLYAGRKKKAETIMEMCEELEQYRAIGTVEGYENAIKAYTETYILMKEYKSKLQDFEAIGTIEELRALKEKNEPKKPIIRPWSDARCPSCGCSLSESLGDGYYKHFETLERCDECNQKLDWQ